MSSDTYPIKKVGLGLLVLLFLMPLLSTLVMMPFANSEAQQYAGLQIFLMGFYNVPALFISLLLFGVAGHYSKKGSANSRILYWLSVAVSIAGILFMGLWGVTAINE